MSYVDGFVLTVQTKKLKEYKKIATTAGKAWMKYGALQYKECIAEDLKAPWALPFPKLVKPKKGETILFSFIVYKNRKHRDQVNAKVMKDANLDCDPNDMPFDCKRMAYGGFETIVDF